MNELVAPDDIGTLRSASSSDSPSSSDSDTVLDSSSDSAPDSPSESIPDSSSNSIPASPSESSLDSDAATATTRIRDRAERVRRREVETALGRLSSDGEVTPAERRILTRLSARLTDALVEHWTANLGEEDVDPETALELLVREE